MTFVVAEIGVNWDGDFELVKEMISQAKGVGCDSVKFQAFNKENIKEHPESERLLKSAITPNNVEQIDKITQDIGIEWFCTPMYPEAVGFLDSYVNKFKIRELDGRCLFDQKPSKLIERVLNTGKKVIISSEKSPKKMKITSEYDIKWLYCVPRYPCRLNELDFSEVDYFDGYSNHCIELAAPICAVSLGLEILEVHITSDKNKNFVDNNVSFDYKELGEIVNFVRDIDKIKRK